MQTKNQTPMDSLINDARHAHKDKKQPKLSTAGNEPQQAADRQGYRELDAAVVYSDSIPNTPLKQEATQKPNQDERLDLGAYKRRRVDDGHS